MIEALQGIDEDEEIEQIEVIDQPQTEQELDLTYPDEFYDDVLNFELDEPEPEVKEKVEFAFSNNHVLTTEGV